MPVTVTVTGQIILLESGGGVIIRRDARQLELGYSSCKLEVRAGKL